MARLPGMVQGVVVQITTDAPASAGWPARTIGKRTQTVCRACDRGIRPRLRPARSSRPTDHITGCAALVERRHSPGTCRSRGRSAPRRRSSIVGVAGRPSRRSRRAAGTRAFCTSIQCAAKSRHSSRNCAIGTRPSICFFARGTAPRLPLDRQAVAVPARHIGRILAEHLLRAVDDVLQDLVQRGAEMDVAVGVGRAVVQDEFLAARARPRAAAVRGPSPPSARASSAPASAARRASGSRSSEEKRSDGNPSAWSSPGMNADAETKRRPDPQPRTGPVIRSIHPRLAMTAMI